MLLLYTFFYGTLVGCYELCPQWNFSCIVEVKWETRLAWFVFRLGYGLDNVGFNSWLGPENFSSLKCPYQLQGPPTLLFSGYWESFPWVMKQPEREADHWPLSSAEVNNEQSYTSPSQYAFMICAGKNSLLQVKLFMFNAEQLIICEMNNSSMERMDFSLYWKVSWVLYYAE
jgi:hypothetical protein